MISISEDNVCLFCLDECESSACENRFGCSCKVIYHNKCMDDWVNIKNVCPICKATISEETSEDTEDTSDVRVLKCGMNLITFVVAIMLCIILALLIVNNQYY